MQPTYVFPEIDKLTSVFRRLNITSEIHVKCLPMTASGKCIIGHFYYTGGVYREEPYFFATIVGHNQEAFLHEVSRAFSGYDLSVTSIHNPQNNFQLKIPRFQTPSQLEMLLDVKGM